MAGRPGAPCNPICSVRVQRWSSVRRKIVVSYRGLDVALTVSSLEEEVEIRMWSVLKGTAVVRGLLDCLGVESDLTNGVTFTLPGTNPITSDVLSDAVAGRNAANTLLKGEVASDGEAVKARVSTHDFHQAGWQAYPSHPCHPTLMEAMFLGIAESKA